MGLRDKWHRARVRRANEMKRKPEFVATGTESEIPRSIMKAVSVAPLKVQSAALKAARRGGAGGLIHSRFINELRHDMAKELQGHPEYRDYTVDKVMECYKGQPAWHIMANAGVTDEDLRALASEALAVWGNNCGGS